MAAANACSPLPSLCMAVCSYVHRIMTRDPVCGLIPGAQGLVVLVHCGCSLITCPCGRWQGEDGRCFQSGAVVLPYTPKHI